MIQIRKFKASIDEIKSYLIDNDEIFFEPMQSRLDITKFSEKIYQNADQYWVFNDERKIGFMAVYFNHPINEFGFITTISICKEFQGTGLGKRLLEEAIGYASENGFKKIRLQVHPHNITAQNLYTKFGFEVIENDGLYYLMSLNIKG
ncbi:MAG: GNAT family N-acetyltransferase [Bacteroidales bacterium]|nr:GNAT family N-acetyltransferase [Bacteroidales bacterium]